MFKLNTSKHTDCSVACGLEDQVRLTYEVGRHRPSAHAAKMSLFAPEGVASHAVSFFSSPISGPLVLVTQAADSPCLGLAVTSCLYLDGHLHVNLLQDEATCYN